MNYLMNDGRLRGHQELYRVHVVEDGLDLAEYGIL